MPTFISLVNFTQQGLAKIKQSPARLEITRQMFASMGAELKAFYLVMGRYDAIIVSEAPDEETVLKLLLTVGSAGAIRTETLRAWPEDEYQDIIASLTAFGAGVAPTGD
jgi:uncharacterized protein with GYD domain